MSRRGWPGAADLAGRAVFEGLKALAARAVVATGVVRRLRLASGGVVILAYHNILPEGVAPCGSRCLHLPRRVFGAQLDALMQTHEIVALDAALEGRGDGGARRPRAVITFDDAYAGALTVGLEEVARRRLPATVFVAPGLLGADAFWWDALVQPGERELPGSVRRLVLRELGGAPAAVSSWARGSGLEWTAPAEPFRPADEALLRSAAEQVGIAFAPHAWSHVDLTFLAEGALDEELRPSLEWLTARFPRVVPYLAYPYGFRSPAVAEAAKRAGCRGGLLSEGGWAPRRAGNPFAVPRMPVPVGLSRWGFALGTGGVAASS